MLSGLHLLLTYTCLYECDHCFLYCSPRAQGTFTIAQLEKAIAQGIEAGVEWLYLEGGEPFLYYPLLVEGLRLAKGSGLKVGLVTNAYWGLSERDAELWLRPLAELGIDDLSVSNDAFHSDEPEHSPAAIVFRTAARMGLPTASICIEAPTARPASALSVGGAVIGGDVLFKGRAADKLTEDLPRQPASRFDSCPHEQLERPSRVHVDPFGHVFVCQGISIGNMWQQSLAEIMAHYDPATHPVVGPLLRGGPAELARAHGFAESGQYVDHCHLCFWLRKQLIERFPEELCPRLVYGIGETEQGGAQG